MGSEAKKPRVSVRHSRGFIIHHARDPNWRKFYLSDEISGWTADGFTKAWSDAVAWSRGPVPHPTPGDSPCK